MYVQCKINTWILHGNNASLLQLWTNGPAKHLTIKAAREEAADAFFFTPRRSTNHATVALQVNATDPLHGTTATMELSKFHNWALHYEKSFTYNLTYNRQFTVEAFQSINCTSIQHDHQLFRKNKLF